MRGCPLTLAKRFGAALVGSDHKSNVFWQLLVQLLTRRSKRRTFYTLFRLGVALLWVFARAFLYIEQTLSESLGKRPQERSPAASLKSFEYAFVTIRMSLLEPEGAIKGLKRELPRASCVFCFSCFCWLYGISSTHFN
jgi:hypothetical protein